jgi:hypothetical protein
LINGHAEPLSNLLTLLTSPGRATKVGGGKSDVEIEAPKQLTTKKMAEAFKLYVAALEMLTEDDPILEQSSAVRREQENLLCTYKELYQ